MNLSVINLNLAEQIRHVTTFLILKKMRKNYFTLMALIILCAGFTLKGHAQDEARLMRFPDINKNLIAFVYAGDIWTVDANGGEAKRLTSHPGMELFPKISPDGRSNAPPPALHTRAGEEGPGR